MMFNWLRAKPEPAPVKKEAFSLAKISPAQNQRRARLMGRTWRLLLNLEQRKDLPSDEVAARKAEMERHILELKALGMANPLEDIKNANRNV